MIAFDQLRYTDANGHFQDMFDLREELQDPNIIALAQIHRADISRKRGRYEATIRMLSALRPTIEQADDHIRGICYQILARAHSVYGYENLFPEAIDNAEKRATDLKETIDTHYHQFSLVEVLQEKAQGYTMLWQPEKALAIYQRTDTSRPFRPLRDQTSYTIIKAQTYCYAGDIRQGLAYAEQGLKMAEQLQSIRYITRLRQMSDRLHVTSLGKEWTMLEARKEILSTLEHMKAGR